MRRFLGQSHTLYQIATVTGLFSMAPSLLLLAHLSLSPQPETFRTTDGKAHPSAFEKALQEERELWKRSEFRRSRQTSMTTRS